MTTCPTCGQETPQKDQVRLLRAVKSTYGNTLPAGTILSFRPQSHPDRVWIVTGHGTGLDLLLGHDCELVEPPDNPYEPSRRVRAAIDVFLTSFPERFRDAFLKAYDEGREPPENPSREEDGNHVEPKK